MKKVGISMLFINYVPLIMEVKILRLGYCGSNNTAVSPSLV